MRVPERHWWTWLLLVSVVTALAAAFYVAGAALYGRFVPLGCVGGIVLVTVLIIDARFAVAGIQAHRRYTLRRRTLVNAPARRDALAVSSEVPGMPAATPGTESTPPPRPLTLTWGYTWAARLGNGWYAGLLLTLPLALSYTAATSTSGAHVSEVVGAALWRGLPLDSGLTYIVLLLGPILLTMLIGLIGIALTPARTVTIRDEGLELRSGFRHRLIRWNDARFFELGEVSAPYPRPFASSAERYILYGSHGYVAWPAAFREHERPRGIPASEARARLDAIRVQVIERTGLKLRTVGTYTGTYTP